MKLKRMNDLVERSTNTLPEAELRTYDIAAKENQAARIHVNKRGNQ